MPGRMQGGDTHHVWHPAAGTQVCNPLQGVAA